jgi:hypothetical protein
VISISARVAASGGQTGPETGSKNTGQASAARTLQPRQAFRRSRPMRLLVASVRCHHCIR